MDRRTFLGTGALAALPALLALTDSGDVSAQSQTPDSFAVALRNRVLAISSLHVAWQVRVVGAAGEAAQMLAGSNELFYVPGNWRCVYQRGQLLFTELCRGQQFVKTARRVGERGILRTEYEGRTPAHKQPLRVISLLLPTPDPALKTALVENDALRMTLEQGQGVRHRYQFDRGTSLLVTYLQMNGDLPKVRREYADYRTDLAVPFSEKIVETRYNRNGAPSLTLESTVTSVAVNQPLDSALFDWRMR